MASNQPRLWSAAGRESTFPSRVRRIAIVPFVFLLAAFLRSPAFLRALAVGCALFILSDIPAPQLAAQDLTVSAAISLREALGEVTSAFEAANPGVDVSLNLGASGDLQRQIEAGAPVDVYVSAATANMDVLSSRGGIDPRTRRDVA